MKKSDIFELKNKVAVVTGGYGHLGSSICNCLAASGGHVIVAGRDIEKCKAKAKELSGKYKTRPMCVEMDISSEESVKEAMRDAARQTGGINILVNNAFFGYEGTSEKEIVSMPEEMWEYGIEGTASTVFRCIKAAIPFMKKSGSIINISSIYGIVSPDPSIYGSSGFNNPPAYGAGKAAVLQFTRYAACHLAPKGIRVNSISPGAFPNRSVQKNKKFISNLKRKIPLGRIGEPKDLAGAVVFLASDASSYVTGSNIVVDGGWTAW